MTTTAQTILPVSSGQQVQQASTLLKWRSDIDGLRALAVVPVVLFHIAPSYMPGGFVGVDIFFVISGYLIGSMILHEIEAGSFHVASFYIRRLRRIWPALASVILFVLVCSLIRDLPVRSIQTAWSALSATTSLANVYFWATANYFAQPSGTLPLLHSWSLAVEEQFYLFLPGLMLLGRGRLKSWRPFIVMTLLIVSLIVSVPMAFRHPSTTFYWLPFRAWELLLGTALAMGLVRQTSSASVREAVSMTGFCLIIFSLIFTKEDLPFPGLLAIPPCAGAAMVIYGGSRGKTYVSSFLSIRPMVFIGAISYSLYLWHWPLIALHRNEPLFVVSSNLIDRAVLLLLSVSLAICSWALVERTTRNSRLVPERLLLTGSGISLFVIVLMSAVIICSGGLPRRLQPSAVEVAQFLDAKQGKHLREDQCFLDANQSFESFDKINCLPKYPKSYNYLVVGDSHAAHLVSGLASSLPDSNVLQVTGVLCPPLIPANDRTGRPCPDLMSFIVRDLIASRKIDVVVLSGRWNGTSINKKSHAYGVNWLERLQSTANIFMSRGIRTVIVGPNPEFSAPLPMLLARSFDEHDPALPQRFLNPNAVELDRVMRQFAEEKGMQYVSLIDALCRDGTCMEYASPGVPLLFDESHFTEAGSHLVGKIIGDFLKK